MTISFRKMTAAIVSMIIGSVLVLTFPAQAHASPPGEELAPSQEEIEAVAPSQAEIDAVKAAVDAKPICPSKNEATIEKSSVSAASLGSYPTFKGTILVTQDKFAGIIPSGHAAIIFRYDTVIESLQDGVTWGANDWNVTKNTAYGAEVISTSSEQDQVAANRCYNQIGKPYNYNFFDIWTRDSFYCSQLVWAAFYDLYRVDISTADFGTAIYPMEILNSPKVNVIYNKSI